MPSYLAALDEVWPCTDGDWMWHNAASQGHILALSSRLKSLKVLRWSVPFLARKG